MQHALSHLVLSDRVLDQLGPAVNGGHSLFVYGPPGNGKTVIAQGVKNLLEGDIAIPHAIDQDGHLVQVYDPVIHETRPQPASEDLDTGDQPDGRWLRCRRPLVTVGGELMMSSLELAYDTDVGLLPRADPARRQRRRAGHRRLRPPALLGASSCSTAGSRRSRAAPTT